MGVVVLMMVLFLFLSLSHSTLQSRKRNGSALSNDPAALKKSKVKRRFCDCGAPVEHVFKNRNHQKCCRKNPEVSIDASFRVP